MKLRVKFKKYGALRFIGHLDVMRFFQKTIRRAEIDVAYTGGYSPHQIMTFASPLGVGLESNGEYMDIEVNSMTSCSDIVVRLNQASVRGIEIVSVKILPENAGNAMASVASAVYTVRFREDRMPQTDISKLLNDFLSQDEIWYTKDGKKGKREIDLKPGIYGLSWDNNTFTMHVNASSAGNIKPGQILEAMFSSAGISLQKNALLITREDLFTNTGTEDTPIFTSLGDIGTL